MKDRSILTVSSVRRSQCFACSESPSVWDMAVFPITGTFGRRAFAMGRGFDMSILAGTLRIYSVTFSVRNQIRD